MAELVAVQDGFALFQSGGMGVVIDTSTLNPCDPQPVQTILASGDWTAPEPDSAFAIYAPTAAFEIAEAAFETIPAVPVVIRGQASLAAAGTRVVRVPKKVQDAVKSAYASESRTRGLPDAVLQVAAQLATGTASVATVERVREQLEASRGGAVYALYGRQDAVEWVNKVCGSTLTAAGPDPTDPTTETDWIDPTKPHAFVLLSDGEIDCAICSKPADDPVHTEGVEMAAEDAPEDAAPGGIEYFATFAPGGDQGSTFKVDTIYAKDETGSWWIRELGDWSPTQALDGSQDYVQLDPESFEAAARQLDEPGTAYAELSISEDRLFSLAAPDLDYELYDAVFAAVPYIPPEVRSANAKKQLRDAQGHFIVNGGVVQDSSGQRGTIARVDHENGTVDVKGQDGQTKTVPANEVAVDRNAGASDPAAAGGPVKATLPTQLPLVPDVKGLIAQYQQKWAQEKGDAVTAAGDEMLIPPPEDSPASATPTASGPSTPAETPAAPADDADPVASAGVTPLYLAEVDANDTAAVLEALAVVPSTGAGDPIDVYKRDNGKWVADETIRSQLQGPTPPPVVELDSDMLANVLGQMDSQPAAQPDNAVAAALRALAASGHAIMQRFELTEMGLTASQVVGARLLTPYKQQEDWPQDVLDRLNEFVLGKEVSPSDVKNTERLRQYWEHGEGAAKIQWGRPGDYMRCVHHLEKYLGHRAYGYCQLRHKAATGFYAGHAPTEQRPHLAASALVGEVQDDQALVAHASDPESDLPHPFAGPGAESDFYDGCESCGRGEDHPIHLVVLIPNAEADEDADPNQPHELEPGPDGMCECGKPANDPIHTLTDNPVPESQDDYDGELDYSTLHEFASAADEEGVCECGRPQADRLHSHGVVADASQVVTPGQRFRIPVVIPEGVTSGDGRTFAKNSLTSRPMPLALMWQPEGDEGHNGAVIVGRVDHVERTPEGLGNAYGVFDTGVWGQEALRLVRNGMLRGISADLDEFEAYAIDGDGDEGNAEADDTEGEAADGEKVVVNLKPKPEKISAQKMLVNKGRLMGVTLVAKPAYAECTIELVDGDESMDGPWHQQPTEEARVAALVAAGVPLNPPAEWFENPNLTKPTHLTVTDEGRVFGHIAAWDIDHIGLPLGTRAPRSVSNYAYFRTGALQTAEGQVVRVGQLTLTGGHAPLKASAREAVKHYDDTASAVADLAAGEDKYGIWVSGALRPGVTPEQVRALRASSPSGDWRPIKGSLELVAVCQVNVPGFPVAEPRAEVMVAGGMVTALVAAGALKQPPATNLTQDEVNARIEKLEAAINRQAADRALAARQRIAPVRTERQQQAITAAMKARERVDVVRNEKREALEARVASVRSRVGAAPLHVAPFDEAKHPRDDEGKFRRVLARLERLFHGTDDASHAAGDAIQQVQDAAGKEEAGDHEGAAASARAGVQKLEDAAQKAGGEAKARLMDAANVVRQAAEGDVPGEGDGTGDEEGAAEVIFDSLAEPIKEQLMEAVSHAEEKLDPANPDELFQKVKAFITGTNPMSVRDVYKFIKNQLKREVAPHGPDAGGGPSPTSPTVKGPQAPQIGNGPLPS